jgi:hypothetical protein
MAFPYHRTMNTISHHPGVRVRSSPRELTQPTLLQFVLLSMLLHVLVVVLFGTTTSTGARRSDGLLGALDVTLRQLSPERGSGFLFAPGTDTSSPGDALLRRLEGATATPPIVPKGGPSDSATPRAELPPVTASPTPVPPEDAGQAVPDAPILSRPSPAEPLPSLNLNAPAEIDRPIIVPTFAPPAPAPARETPVVPMMPLERVAPPKLERQLAPPVELRPREVPITPRMPPVEQKPVAEPATNTAPADLAAPAKVEAEAPAEVRPREVPVMPPLAPIERIAPARIEHQIAPPMDLPAPRKAPVETPAPPRVAPPIEREAAPAPQSVPRIEPVEVTPGRERAAPAKAVPGKPAPAQVPSRNESPPGERLRFGAPDVDDEVFRSKRDAPAGEAGGAPPVTVESMRRRAREIAAEGGGSRGVLNLVPPPPPLERKDTLAEGIAKAVKPDCRTAYAGMGLLAVVPLVASSVGKGGCNW